MRMTLFGGSHQYAGIEEHLHAFNTDSTRSSRTSWITRSQFAPGCATPDEPRTRRSWLTPAAPRLSAITRRPADPGPRVMCLALVQGALVGGFGTTIRPDLSIVSFIPVDDATCHIFGH
jgi:hypothetical protein